MKTTNLLSKSREIIGYRSIEKLEVWRGEGESISDLVILLVVLLTLRVAGEDLFGVSKRDLFHNQTSYIHNHIIIGQRKL